MLFSLERDNEAYIHFELYRLLVNRGFQVYPEYRHKPNIDERACRFDLVLHCKGEIYLIIEVKRSKRSQDYYRRSRQYKRYSAHGVPVIHVNARYDLVQVVELIAQRWSDKLD